MGNYLNPSSAKFKRSLASDIYVDKSELIEVVNQVIGTEQQYVCVSRPRRFGKSMAANMLAAYYGCEEDTSGLFDRLKISRSPSYLEHLNRHDVIMLNMQEFLSRTKSVEDMLARVERFLIWELKNQYPDVFLLDETDLIQVMKDIYISQNHTFIILIDEWDCLFREYKNDVGAQKKYLDFLRTLLKDQEYVGLAYMTGILPIKKYGTHSALNMFSEYSMASLGKLVPYFGFTEEEVQKLCEEYDMSFEETKSWYDGYQFVLPKGEPVSIYSPKSVVESMLNHCFQNYWNQTETYEALKMYIQMNMDGLKDAVVTMLADGRVCINTRKFSNDMTTFSGKDDILTLLVHLGYLTYDISSESVAIPNREVRQEYKNSIEDLGWDEVMRSLNNSKNLLQALWNMDAKTVAEGIERTHQEVSILQYNDENALSYTINLAFYAAKEYYNVYREFPSGKGFADICMIPRKLYGDKPAVIIELKWDKNATGAIAQVKERQYVNALRDYHGNVLMAGINYDKKEKSHTCVIEKTQM